MRDRARNRRDAHQLFVDTMKSIANDFHWSLLLILTGSHYAQFDQFFNLFLFIGSFGKLMPR